MSFLIVTLEHKLRHKFPAITREHDMRSYYSLQGRPNILRGPRFSCIAVRLMGLTMRQATYNTL